MTGKTFENREYLKWHEAAEVLGMDSEGLRQALRNRFSQDIYTSGEQWLPVVLTTRNEGFLASLVCGEPDKQPMFYWSSRDSYYERCEGKQQLEFSDGSALELNGRHGSDYWEANHGYGSGYIMPFTVGGQTLIVSPASVRHACDHDGYFDSVDIAPRDWCKEGFPLVFFHVVERPGSMFQRKPVSLFDEGQFLAEDVMRMLEESMDKPGTAASKKGLKRSKSAGSSPDDHVLDRREEAAYLNAIGALLHLMLGETPAGKPQSVFASQAKIIEAMLAHHGEKYGISQRKLEETFAAAKRSLKS